MNFFMDIRRIAAVVVLSTSTQQRWEVDLGSAELIKISPAGVDFKFFVRFDAMTPGGDHKFMFVQVNQEGDQMVARHPFCNTSSSFSLEPYRAVWFAPREPSQQDVAEAALYRNHFGKDR